MILKSITKSSFLLNWNFFTSIEYCDRTHTCSGHGSCKPNVGTCVCDEGFNGLNCACSNVETCSSHGTCQNDGQCKCDPNFFGEKCDKMKTTKGKTPCFQVNIKLCGAVFNC